MQAQLAQRENNLTVAFSADSTPHEQDDLQHVPAPQGDRPAMEMKAIQEAIARVEAEAKAACAAESRAHAEARARALAEDRGAMDAAAAAAA
ncbi:MAG: hypothetical protein JO370_13945, partial [Paucibacter sp.]|nr:hypothetical protein [Roseateles sp.]